MEIKVSHEKLATPPLEERTRTFLRPINNCGQTKAGLGALHRVCLIKQSSLLPRRKKTSDSSSNPFYVSSWLVSCRMSFQYLIICAVLISQIQVLSTLLLYMGVYMADFTSGRDELILSAREYLLCPARKDFVLTT